MEAWLSTWERLLWADGRVTLIALGAVVLLTALELLFPAEAGQGVRGRARNLVYLVQYKLLGLGGVAAWFAFGPTIELMAHSPSAGEGLLLLLGNLICIDFLYYWYHRAQHHFRFLWAIHELHHADVELNATSSYRTYWLEAPVQMILVTTPTLLLFGWLGEDHARNVLGCSLSFLIFSHANLKLPLGAVGRWLIGPQVHRIHHSRLPEHQDRNFAQFFPFLDRLFGSFWAPARAEFPPTGTPGLASDAPLTEAIVRPLLLWKAELRGLAAADG